MRVEISSKMKAAVCGLVLVAAAGGCWSYIREQERRLEVKTGTSPVLQARRYIAVGKSVTADLVEEVQMPAAFVPPGALRAKADLTNDKGKPLFKARIGLPKTDPVTRSKLVEDSALVGLAWTLQPGETALSLRFSLEDAVSGLLRPGDAVNVLLTTKERSRLLLGGVRVAAVQDRLWNAGEETADFSKTALASDSILVTLVLTPRETLRARLAAETGRLALSLASPLETEAPAVSAVRSGNGEF